jgi:hypothetical protein
MSSVTSLGPVSARRSTAWPDPDRAATVAAFSTSVPARAFHANLGQCPDASVVLREE